MTFAALAGRIVVLLSLSAGTEGHRSSLQPSTDLVDAGSRADTTCCCTGEEEVPSSAVPDAADTACYQDEGDGALDKGDIVEGTRVLLTQLLDQHSRPMMKHDDGRILSCPYSRCVVPTASLGPNERINAPAGVLVRRIRSSQLAVVALDGLQEFVTVPWGHLHIERAKPSGMTMKENHVVVKSVSGQFRCCKQIKGQSCQSSRFTFRSHNKYTTALSDLLGDQKVFDPETCAVAGGPAAESPGVGGVDAMQHTPFLHETFDFEPLFKGAKDGRGVGNVFHHPDGSNMWKCCVTSAGDKKYHIRSILTTAPRDVACRVWSPDSCGCLVADGEETERSGCMKPLQEMAMTVNLPAEWLLQANAHARSVGKPVCHKNMQTTLWNPAETLPSGRSCYTFDMLALNDGRVVDPELVDRDACLHAGSIVEISLDGKIDARVASTGSATFSTCAQWEPTGCAWPQQLIGGIGKSPLDPSRSCDVRLPEMTPVDKYFAFRMPCARDEKMAWKLQCEEDMGRGGEYGERILVRKCELDSCEQGMFVNSEWFDESECYKRCRETTPSSKAQCGTHHCTDIELGNEGYEAKVDGCEWHALKEPPSTAKPQCSSDADCSPEMSCLDEASDAFVDSCPWRVSCYCRSRYERCLESNGLVGSLPAQVAAHLGHRKENCEKLHCEGREFLCKPRAQWPALWESAHRCNRNVRKEVAERNAESWAWTKGGGHQAHMHETKHAQEKSYPCPAGMEGKSVYRCKHLEHCWHCRCSNGQEECFS